LGNIIDALEISKKYSTESIRYFLLSEADVVNDSDFSELLFKRHVNLLADQYGNLLLRAFGKTLYPEITEIKLSKITNQDLQLINSLNNLYNLINLNYEQGNFKAGLRHVWKILRDANKLFEDEKPWLLKPKDERLQTLQFIIIE